MRTYVSLAVAGSLGILAIVVLRTARDIATPPTISSFQATEVARVRAHFDSVLVELSAKRDAQLTPGQRDRRAAILTILRTYTERGEFPKNYDFPGRQVPYFIDRKTGVRCAVAYLLESTGRTDIVHRVAATNNNVRVSQLANDTAFTAWIDAWGLTLTDAARIQPSYEAETRRDRRQYAQASAVALTAAVGTTAMNLTVNDEGRYPLVSVFGILAGAGTIGLGALNFLPSDRAEQSPGLAWTNIVAGSVGVIVGVRTLTRRRGAGATASEMNASGSAADGRGLTGLVTPTFSLVGQRSAGVQVQLRF